MWSGDCSVGDWTITCFMPRARFFNIKHHICFNTWGNDDNAEYENHPFKKWMRGLDQIRWNSIHLFRDPDIFAIDEMRVKASSRKDPYSTFLKQKPIRKGRNIYTVGCASRHHHGLVHSVVPYCGEDTYTDPTQLKMDNVVDQLMDQTVVNGHEIFVSDSGFTSIYNETVLAKKYGEAKRGDGARIGYVGVINRTRVCLPKDLFASDEWKDEEKNMERGDYVQFHCRDSKLMLTIWQDTKLLTLLDNCLNPFRMTTVKRRKGAEVNEYEVPYVCQFYNMFMGEVDAASMHRTTFHIDRKHQRNDNREFWALLESYALVNTAILCSDIYKDREVRHKAYRSVLVSTWRQRYIAYRHANNLLKRRARPTTKQQIVISTLDKCRDAIGSAIVHRLVKYDTDNPKRQIKCRQCHRKTTYVCSICVQFIGFCHIATTGRDCFTEWHEDIDDYVHHTIQPM